MGLYLTASDFLTHLLSHLWRLSRLQSLFTSTHIRIITIQGHLLSAFNFQSRFAKVAEQFDFESLPAAQRQHQ